MDIIFYTARKLAALLPVLLVISLFSFFLGVAAPGDPAYLMLVADGLTEPSEEEVSEMREKLGLNQPLHIRYFSWLFGAVQGEFGRSFEDGREVGKEIIRRFPVTIRLSLLSLFISSLLGIGWGLLMARFANRLLDHIGQVLAMCLISIPGFWLAILMIGFFSEALRLLPTSGSETFYHLIMPAFVLAAGTIGLTMRLTRGVLLEEMHKLYIVTADSKGLKQRIVHCFHAFPNALIPIITVLGTYWGNILGGSVIVETIFSVPGIGEYAITAISNRDFPVVQAYVWLTGTTFVLVNLAIDLFYFFLDPKLFMAGGDQCE